MVSPASRPVYTGAMRRFIWRWARRALFAAGIALATFLVVRTVQIESGPPLQPWHTYLPPEPSRTAVDRLDWARWLATEEELFANLRRNVTDRLSPELRTPDNRFFAESPVNPERFPQDWNRSYTLTPAGAPRGAVVLLHGLTDSPYSLRHFAQRYREAGFVVIAPRMPGHGTVPAGLVKAEWEDWQAVTRLAMRTARAQVPAPLPLHIIGFSNGGALAMQYALDAIEQPSLARPDRLILFSPMIGITEFARFVGLAEIPAWLPAFSKASWLSIVPEFNPFKYNSFPVNGARQSRRLTVALQAQVQRLARAGQLGSLAPVLTVQSIPDFTVLTRAIVTSLYAHLPANGSELVLIDRNAASKLGPLLRPAATAAAERITPPPPLAYRLTLLANDTPNSAAVVARITEPGSRTTRLEPLGLDYPSDVFSLSHVAIPFPRGDGLYGAEPGPGEDFGVNFGGVATRGETGLLLISQDSLTRMSWNPFFPYVMQRIEEGLGPR